MADQTSSSPASRWTVRPLRAEDHDAWLPLRRGYAAFYGRTPTPEQDERLWSWLLDPAHESEGLVAVDEDDRPVGLAHVRPFARPLAVETGLFLDDLFVDPAQRGQGIARVLLDHLRELAAERGCDVVRWLTAEDNATARGLYDQVATATPFVTYDMPVR